MHLIGIVTMLEAVVTLLGNAKQAKIVRNISFAS